MSRESRPIPTVLLQISACLPLVFGLSGSLKHYVLLPTPPCILSPSMFPFYVSPVLAAQLLLFHSSPTAFFPLSWENCSCRSPSTHRPTSVFSDPFCFAPCHSSNVLSLVLSIRFPLPLFNFLPIWLVPCCFLNLLLLSTFNQFPIRVFYLFLPVLYFIAF